ncbi:CDP-alcohol phosphatidyltransferase family protein [Deinococcus psychrotolerans]|uniref:CDP-alcohol phosphatidyltransferase family protein n=1 Tax=Deinococcus psychrotolerans TaxID=2489213 RepID=A0A3G8YD77_9DEIO|nr:CDP-alcohol phosphatidyltransferase family protein [Deinococcus psychrotolerans]AZI43359.1 CDP-alcohol phosphatidyltransferase family protein [Deinococcus psychrotolerans]
MTGDRRPIAARDSGVMQRLAAWLILRRASANDISLLGMGAALLAGGCFALVPSLPQATWVWWLLGAALVQLRLLANLLDGMVAIGRGVASPVGELFNEVPDRVSDTTILLGLGWAAGELSLGLGAALAAMTTAYIRAVGRSAGAPSDFRGPLAKPQRMALVTLAAVWCAVTPATWSAAVPTLALWVILLGAALTAARRLTGISQALRRLH